MAGVHPSNKARDNRLLIDEKSANEHSPLSVRGERKVKERGCRWRCGEGCGSDVAKAEAQGELVAFVGGKIEGGLFEGVGVGFEQDEVGGGDECDGCEQMLEAGFDPGLLVDDDDDEEGEEDEVADDHQWEIVEGAGAEVGEGNGADGEEAEVDEQEGAADSYEKLGCGDEWRSQGGGREGVEDRAVARVMSRAQRVIQRRAPAMWPGWGRPMSARKSQGPRRSMGAEMVLVRPMTVQNAMMGTAVRMP